MRKHLLSIILSMSLIISLMMSSAYAVATPAKVTTFSARAASATSVKLTWKKVSKISGYQIYRNGKALKKVGKNVATYSNTGLKQGTKYSYYIRTYNTYKQKQYYNSKTKKWVVKKPAASQWKGKKTRNVTKYKYGSKSVTRTVTTPYITPAKVAGLKGSSTTSAVTLSWNKVAASGYSVYRNGSLTGNTNGITYTDKSLKDGTTYTYQIRAYNTVSGKKIYGAFSAKLNVATKKIPVPDPAPTPTVDTAFSGSSLSNIAINKGDVVSIKLKTSKTGIENAIKWSISDSSVASIERALWNGTEIRLTGLKAGAAMLTATNWDGQKKTSTITVKAVKPETDTLFTGVTLTNKTVTLGDNNSFIYTVKTSKTDIENAIVWTSSNPSVATVTRNLWNGTEAKVTCKSAGTTVITATSWDGQTKKATVTVNAASNPSSGNDPGENPSGGDDPSAGGSASAEAINTSFGQISPNSDGSFTIISDWQSDNSYKTPLKINGVECGISILDELPSGSVINVNAADYYWHNNKYQGEKYFEPYIYGYFIKGENISSDNQNVALTETYFLGDGETALYFIDSGSSNVQIGTKTFRFVVSGQNEYNKPYVDLLNSWPSQVSGTTYDKIDATVKHLIRSNTYGSGNYRSMVHTGIGSCQGSNVLFKKLCDRMDIPCENFYDYRSEALSGDHVVSKVNIDGTDYFVDATPATEGWNVTDSQIRTQRFYLWSRYEELYGN